MTQRSQKANCGGQPGARAQREWERKQQPRRCPQEEPGFRKWRKCSKCGDREGSTDDTLGSEDRVGGLGHWTVSTVGWQPGDSVYCLRPWRSQADSDRP